MSKQDLVDYINNQTPQKLQSFEILSKEKTLQPFLIRIDKNPPKYFFPVMPAKAMTGEDRTIPRISTASTIDDCLRGYKVFFSDIVYGKQEESDAFKNGYVISRLTFDHCVAPKKKLVPDVKDTNEYWIVGYNKDHVNIKQETVGKIVFGEMITKGSSEHKDYNPIEIVWYVEILNEEGLYFTDKIMLAKGYHKLVVDYTDDVPTVTHTIMTEDSYIAIKKLSAALLSLESKPAFSNW